MKKSLGILGMLGAILGMNSTHAFKDSNDVKGKKEGKQSSVSSFGANHQPIYIPSRSQKIKSKQLAKRNAKR